MTSAPKIDAIVEYPLVLRAFNWEDPDDPHECEGLDTEGLPDYEVLDYYDCGATALISPEHVYSGLRNGVGLIQGKSIKGYCYTCRFKYRHEEDDDGKPYRIESHYLETYAIFMTDGFQVYDAYYMECDALGRPNGWEERFEKPVWNQP